MQQTIIIFIKSYQLILRCGLSICHRSIIARNGQISQKRCIIFRWDITEENESILLDFQQLSIQWHLSTLDYKTTRQYCKYWGRLKSACGTNRDQRQSQSNNGSKNLLLFLKMFWLWRRIFLLQSKELTLNQKFLKSVIHISWFRTSFRVVSSEYVPVNLWSIQI